MSVKGKNTLAEDNMKLNCWFNKHISKVKYTLEDSYFTKDHPSIHIDLILYLILEDGRMRERKKHNKQHI